ncbi:peroxisomal NADH pyrophosphatase nudt12 [Plakobranchus ocellatus]|uniref:NAD-capped RNA hydrolase NUDT12 n=1 Tax=Plakobranchus ocellatus TaxID=259542 RepID=A0AAV4BP86_9GAST|nr:peroxisomal NADH pyrophosphatase nudt12 [Plakobranchus ocellatus]
MTSSGVKQFNQKFLDAAAHGNLDELKSLLGAVDTDVKSDRGWTALMFAARNGHVSIISALIEKGCDVQCMNSSGQTALEIAQFWNHKDAAAVLSQHKENVLFDQTHNYYSVNPLYRASDLRKDASALQALKKDGSSKFILFEEQKPFLLPPDGERRKYKFALFSCNQLSASLLDQSSVIFLGLETWDPSSSAWFAVNVKENGAEIAKKMYPEGVFVTPFPATMQMEGTHAGIFAEAHSILCWLDRYKFCATCGSPQTVVEGGYKQVCSNADCPSHKGVHNTCYPRVDPSLIMLVVSPDKKMCLLGRQKRFPPKMFSCLAGFMEPGECIEDTCRREVEEESGVKVGRVSYHSSQPWPFPATLMLGCIAYARTDVISVDKEELEEAHWFPRAEVAQMLAGKHPDGLFLPPKQAIAHQLIKTWVAGSSAHL